MPLPRGTPGGNERLERALSGVQGSRFVILYGEGVEDLYLNRRRQELRFGEALYEALRRQGYECVAFYAPHRSLYFYDRQSAERVRQGAGGELEPGPLQEVQVFGGSGAGVSTQVHGRGMGDVHALRVMDALMSGESGMRTAVVFLQAESALRHFEDRRTLAGILGDWGQLPASSRSQCLFAFSAGDYAGLVERVKGLELPELRSAVEHSQGQGAVVRVEGASQEELQRALRVAQEKWGKVVREEQQEALVRRMAAEGEGLRRWLVRLQEVERVELAEARRRGWFSGWGREERSALERLEGLVGLAAVKDRLRELYAWVQVKQKGVRSSGTVRSSDTLHMLFTGNPGTGKTTVARLWGELLAEAGVLERGHLVEVQAADLVAEYVGGTGLKTNQVVDRALGGVLFIDEAYALVGERRGGYGSEALEALLVRMEAERGRLVVIAAGYPEQMGRFRRANPGLERRFPAANLVHFPDFTPEELWEILQGMLVERGLRLETEGEKALWQVVQGLVRGRSAGFGNAGEMRNLVEGVERKRALRVVQGKLGMDEGVKQEDLPESYRSYLPGMMGDAAEVLKELDGLVGLGSVKEKLRLMAERMAYEQLRYQAGVEGAGKPRVEHLVFMGSPGTGKTTVARWLGRYLRAVGVLGRGQCVEASRVELVAGYVGQTAQRTLEKVKEALDGVLFVDEAYTLERGYGEDFGREAVDTLVKAMEDYRERLVVVAAGYPEAMHGFLNANPGLSSRFGEVVVFEDFNAEELEQILVDLADGQGYRAEEGVWERAVGVLEAQKGMQGERFGNARSALALFEQIKTRAAARVMGQVRNQEGAPEREQLTSILLIDLPEAEFPLFSKTGSLTRLARCRQPRKQLPASVCDLN
jgi:SpoVK/Ycf46/Vps4 family AAA+-type ATPase